MKISNFESGKASGNTGAVESKILPENRPKGSISSKSETTKQLSPLEQGMLVAEAALADIPDTREQLVNEIKERIQKGEYNVSGKDIAEMMLRRHAADRIR